MTPRAPFRVPLSVLLAKLLVAVATPAQSTWIFDSAGGGNFTNLQVAVDSVAPGDTILLRSTYYHEVRIRKSLHLVGDAPNILVLALWLEGQAGSPIECSLSNFYNYELRADNAILSGEGIDGADLFLDGCSAAFANCGFYGSRVAQGGSRLRGGSRAAFDNCAFDSHSWTTWMGRVCTDYPGTPALSLAGGSHAQLTDCSLQGAGVGYTCNNRHPGYPAIEVGVGCSVDLARCTATALGSGVPSIVNHGIVREDGTVTIPPFTGAVPAMLPSTRGTGAGQGGVVQARVEGRPGLPAVIVASLGLRPPVSAPEGQVWVNPSAYVVLRIGLLDASGRMDATVNVPGGVQRGLSLTFQGAVSQPPSPALIGAVPTVLHVL